MATVKSLLPECGLYRTTRPLAGHEDQFPAGLLVYFHNHSDAGLPQVLAPDHNVHNRWHFHGPGVLLRGLSWPETLEAVPAEGFYVLRRDLGFEGGTWPKGSLVQLGYTKSADPIVFIGQLRASEKENTLFFSDRGVGLKREQFALLEPVTVFSEQASGSGGEGGDAAADHGPANLH